MSIDITKRSRLQFAELLSVDGVEFWDALNLPVIAIQSDDIAHQVSSSDRIDTLANQYYGDSVLWWVIATANGLELIPAELYEGQTLRIPSPRYVLQELFKQATKRR